MPKPPIAAKRPHPHVIHGDTRPDDYYWLNQKSDKDVIAYLTAENQYFEETTASLAPLQQALYDDMKRHLPDVEESPPAQHGPYYYYWRINPTQQYKAYYRQRASNRRELHESREELLLDVNTLVDGNQYIDVSTVSVSPDHTKLLYLENRDGSDRYTLYIKDLGQNRLIGTPIPNVFIGSSTAWSLSGNAIYYLEVDATQKPYRLIRQPLDQPHREILYEEPSEDRSLELSTSQSGQYLFLNSTSKTSSETRYLNLADPKSSLILFQKRRPGVLYTLEHWNEHLLCLTNDGAQNFEVLWAPLENPRPEALTPLIPHQAERYVQALLPFSRGLVVMGREEGLSQVWLFKDNRMNRINWDEPVYTALARFNRDYGAREVLIHYESLVTPPTDFAVDLDTDAKTPIRQDGVKEYDEKAYRQLRLWATAQDGTSVPISLVGRTDALLEQPCPLILYGYGSYGSNADPRFDLRRLPVLDRGVLFAIAHVRGGSEMGYQWYQDGKLLKKRNTFTDFIDAAEFLVNAGYTQPHRLAVQGRSAGGLLMGAIINMRPDLFQVAASGVPFVDVVTTMLDASIPLTTLEWDEWGNPEEPEYYQYMKSYSPYDNVTAQDYPHLYVTTGLNDPRVGYFEPAKWVAKLREKKTDQNQLVLWTHMGSGHFGSSGRLPRLWESARELAFILDKIITPSNRISR